MLGAERSGGGVPVLDCSIFIEYKSESNTTPGSDCSVGCSHLMVVKRSSHGFELVSDIYVVVSVTNNLSDSILLCVL